MPEFDSQLRRACETVLSDVLGPDGIRSTAWHLSKLGVELSDCSRRPQEFDDALVQLFQPMGALLIENKILALLYRGLGNSYHGAGSLSFGEEITKAKVRFEATDQLGTSSGTSPSVSRIAG